MSLIDDLEALEAQAKERIAEASTQEKLEAARVALLAARASSRASCA